MASLSISFLTYAASLAQNGALDNNTLLVLNSIWFITTGGSLFIAGSTGLVAAVIGTLPPPAKPKARLQFYASFVTFFVILGLFIMLFSMVAGLILLANGLSVNTPLGNIHLPPAAIFPLLAVAVVIMLIVTSLMYLGST